MIIFQFALVIVLVITMLGPLGHSFFNGIVPLHLLAFWALTWFGNRLISLRLAIAFGLVMDLIGFLPLGFWTLNSLIIVGIVDLLKSRWFDIASLPLSLIALGIAFVVSTAMFLLVGSLFDLRLILQMLIITVGLGALMYYILAFRFRFLQRWRGRQL